MQLPESFHLAWAHYYPPFIFAKGGVGCLLSIRGGIEALPCLTHRMNDVTGAHPLSVCRKGEWRTNSYKELNLNRTKDGWEESQLCWLSSFSLLSLCLLTLPAGVWFGCFSFKSWAKCFYYIQLERHLDQSFITPTFNQDGLQTGEAIPPAPSTLKFRRVYDLFFGRCCGSTASTAFQLPQWETPIGKSRAPQCKYCFLFTHKQKIVTDTENTVVLHSFPKQT